MIAALLLLAAPEVEVLVLSKHALARVELTAGDCRVEGLADPVTSLALDGARVRACARRRCVSVPEARLACAAPATLRSPATGPRVYGERLRARARGGALRLIASVPLEGYVAGVVAAELAEAPPAAREAQAVLARTFALRARTDPRHDDAPLCDLTHCQTFAGARAPLAEVPRVLVDEAGAVADVFFHSTCGGETVAPRRMWGDRGAPEVVGVSDLDPEGRAWCRASPHYRWVHELSDHRLAAAIGGLSTRALDAGTLALAPTSRDATEWSVGDLEGSVRVRGEALHLALSRALGFGAVKSSDFAVERAGDTLRLRGRGLGHRVGLCQEGAIARAKAGADAAAILAAYFPRLRLEPSP